MKLISAASHCVTDCVVRGQGSGLFWSGEVLFVGCRSQHALLWWQQADTSSLFCPDMTFLIRRPHLIIPYDPAGDIAYEPRESQLFSTREFPAISNLTRQAPPLSCLLLCPSPATPFLVPLTWPRPLSSDTSLICCVPDCPLPLLPPCISLTFLPRAVQ